MLHETSRLLSRLTDYAAVVVGPPHEGATLASVQLVSLSPRAVLLVVVLSNGSVEDHHLEPDADAAETTVNAASAHLRGTPSARRRVPSPTCPPAATPPSTPCARLRSASCAGAAAATTSCTSAARPTWPPRSTPSTSSATCSIPSSSSTSWCPLLRDVLHRGLSWRSAPSTASSLGGVLSGRRPYIVEGEPIGTIGVLGPTRMNYPQRLAAVDVVSERLGRRLSDG
jgi:heat-inducible transcriptional repressor